MSINPKLQKLFDDSRTAYAVLPHPDAYSAQRIAQAVHVPCRQFAKVLVLRDQQAADFMVVLPASEQLDMQGLGRAIGRVGVALEDERELARLFPDCEVGAMPPFGNLYRLPTYVDPCLFLKDDLYFQAGNHREIVLMRTMEYQRLAQPFVFGCLHDTLVETTS